MRLHERLAHSSNTERSLSSNTLSSAVHGMFQVTPQSFIGGSSLAHIAFALAVGGSFVATARTQRSPAAPRSASHAFAEKQLHQASLASARIASTRRTLSRVVHRVRHASPSGCAGQFAYLAQKLSQACVSFGLAGVAARPPHATITNETAASAPAERVRGPREIFIHGILGGLSSSRTIL